MSFNVTPKAGPSIPFIEKPAGTSDAARASRERAINAFMGGRQDSTQPANQQPPQPQDAFDVALAKANAAAQANAENSLPAPETPAPTGQTDTGGTAATSQPAKVESETPLSQHYATLARKEQALRAEVKRLNAERAAFKAEREAAKAPQASASTPAAPATEPPSSIARDRLLNDPVSVFEELGLSAEELANRLLNHQPVDNRLTSYIGKLEEKIAKLEASQDETRKAYEQNQSQSYEQAVKAIDAEARRLVYTDPEFATIKATGQHGEVTNLIKEVFEKGLEGQYEAGTLLTVEEAARLVEDELVQQWVEQHEKLSKLEKIQKRLQPKAPAPVAEQGTPAQGQSQQQPGQIKTLSNSLPTSGKKLSARERAIAVFQGQKVS